jgi:GT2 family glycosyltransferase
LVTHSPRVSILLPVYQAEATLETCLSSIARQTEPRFECVIVDDGSSDRSLAIARSLDDPRFRVLDAPHGGLIPTLNRGLAACRAPVVARMDADDIMRRDRLELQLVALDAAPELSAVGAHVRIFPRATLTDGLRSYERWLNGIDSPDALAREAFVECPIAHPTLCIRSDVLRRFAYRDAAWPEDYDLVLRMLASGHRLGVVPKRLHLWRDGPTRLSRTDPRYSLAAMTACRASFLAGSLLSEGDEYVLWGYGDTGKALRRALLQHEKRPQAIVELHPRRLGQKIHGAPVVPPEALPDMRGTPVVVSVAGPIARSQIREALARMHFVELSDFICCA